MAGKPRRTKFDPEQHADIAIDLMIAGLSLSAVWAFLKKTERTAPKTDAQFASLIATAKDRLRERTDRHADIEQELHLARMSSLYKAAVAAGQLSVAMSIEKELHRKTERRRRAIAETEAENAVGTSNNTPADGVIQGSGEVFRAKMDAARQPRVGG